VHIALDGSDLATKKFDGTSVYVREILPLLASELIRRGHKVTVFSHTPINNGVFGSEIEICITKGRRFWTQTVLSRALFRLRPDLLFLPIQTVPLYRPVNLKVVATIHDLDFLEYPQMFDFKNLFLLRWFTRVVARNATRLIAVSNTTKDCIIKNYKRKEEDISVVYHGYEEKRFRLPASEDERSEVTGNVRKKYSIPTDCILFVGAFQPRKNIETLISAFELLKKSGKPQHLVLVSGNAWKSGKIIDRINKSLFKEHIHVLKNVPNEDLVGLYWNARVFVLPSFAEGFGLPLLEAMACGVPAVVSNVSALSEIGKRGAVLCDPKSPEDFCVAIEKILLSEEEFKKYQDAGLQRAKDFSWERSAQETADAIEKSFDKI
jgi:glycosyltransferase involved in cell wall biosynthesis